MPVSPVVKQERQQLSEDKTTEEKNPCQTRNKMAIGVRGENV